MIIKIIEEVSFEHPQGLDIRISLNKKIYVFGILLFTKISKTIK